MLKKLGLALVALTLPFLAQAAEPFVEGQHYFEIDTPVRTIDQSKIEVVEMFGYPCPHCNAFEPFIEHWDKSRSEDVNFVRIPVVFGKSWEPMARAYYVSELMGTLDKTHAPTFHAMHVERKRFVNEAQLGDFYASLGVDKDKFMKNYKSFAVNMKLNQGGAKMRGYGITGVPSMVVNGKYRVTAQSAGDQKKMLEVVNYLVEKERNAQ